MGELEDMFKELEATVNHEWSDDRMLEVWGDDITIAEPDQTIKAAEDVTIMDGTEDRPRSSRLDESTVISIHADGSASMNLAGASVTLLPRKASPYSGGEYEIRELIGMGGMGVVNRARQASLDRSIVVKSIRPEYASRPDAQGKFITEALATASLDHPNIVPIHDMGVAEDGSLFYVMKEVRGRNWRAQLSSLSESENIDILLRVCDAVAYAHDHGIIHRDIKPENVMLGDFGEVMLMDWGLAAAIEPNAKATRLTPSNSCAGTPSFMAPEMARGLTRDIGDWSDQYLLGATLFNILTGTPPHPGKNAQEGIHNAAGNVLRESPRRDEWMAVALKAMDFQPRRRFASVKAFQQALTECRVHHDSIVLTTQAASLLADAEADEELSDNYPRAINAYEQALVLWAENPRAKVGLAAVRRAYARFLIRKEDFGLALSLLRDAGEDDQKLVQQARAGLERRATRRRLVRVLGVTAAVLLILVAGVSAVSYVWISRQAEAERHARQEAEEQRLIAQQEREEADEQRRIAVAQRAEADASRRRTEAALLQVQEARRAEAAAQEAQLREQTAKLAAEEQARLRAEEALRAQEEIQRLGYLEDNTRWRFDAATAEAMRADAARDFNLEERREVDLGNGAVVDLLLIPPGGFVMGSPPRDPTRNNDEYLHEVELTTPFFLSRTEVTRAQWQAVVGIERLADLGLEPGDPAIPDVLWRLRKVPDADRDLPATGVSHDDITAKFLPALAARQTAGRFRLPTEAEWEWAVRAGTTGHFYTGEGEDDLARAAWYEKNGGGRVRPVGGKQPNAWGLHDALGNAWELVQDSYDALFYLRSPRQDPVNLDDAIPVKVCRGGSYINSSRLCRVSYRATYIHRENRYPHAGFRLAWSPE